MKSYKAFLNEALVTFGKANPKFGHILFLAGGAGSGKGFILNNLIDLQGKVFDVDALKTMLLKKATFLSELEKTLKAMKKEGTIKKVPDVYGKNSGDMFKDSSIVTAMHLTVAALKVPKRLQQTMINVALQSADKKPNLIFDVTLKDVTKLHNTIQLLGGYDKKNIHIAWIINDVAVAMQQNKDRARVVPENILIDTHKGVARTMSDLINMGEKLRKLIDGKIVLIPNKAGIDNELVKSGRGGQYFKKATLITIKQPGKAPDLSKITKELESKIQTYVPKDTFKLER